VAPVRLGCGYGPRTESVGTGVAVLGENDDESPVEVGFCGVSVPFFKEVARNDPALVLMFSSRTLG